MEPGSYPPADTATSHRSGFGLPWARLSSDHYHDNPPILLGMAAIPAGRRRNISAGGFQIWDIHLTGVLMVIGLLPVTGLLLAWQPLTKRRCHRACDGPVRGKHGTLGTVYSRPPGLQVRYYASPFESHTILRSYRPDWLIQLAREHAFETSRARPQQDISVPAKNAATARCGAYRTRFLP